MHPPPFAVAGMSSASNPHHSGSAAWGGTQTSGPLSSSLSDTISQSRSQYQPGYMMSTSQNTTTPPGNQRIDEVPIVQTKAKMNHVLSRGSTSDFGMDSMFESSRQRQTLTDEDAPPTNSINDIPNEIHVESRPPVRFQLKHSPSNTSYARRHVRPASIPQLPQVLYVIIFGYPPDKYSVTVEYFKSIGETTNADPNTEILNCFRIGYKDPGDAMRAVRKNGEILGRSYMVGAKWADPAQAEALVGLRGVTASVPLSDHNQVQAATNPMVIDGISSYSHTNSTPAVGTPIKLAPSASAFRKPESAEKVSLHGRGGMPLNVNPGSISEHPPNKGMLGQVSDLIFGW